MKLRSKLSAIAAAAMLLFTGVGFAAWTFTHSVNASATATAKVTAAIEADDLQVTDGAGNAVSSLYLICDAPTGETGLLDGNGIYWSTENSNDVSKKITSLTLIGSVNEDDNDIADITTYDGHFAMTSTAAFTGTYVSVAAGSLDTTVTSASKNADVQYVWNLPAVSYLTVPSDVSEVNDLQTEVASISLTFAFTFNVSDIN